MSQIQILILRTVNVKQTIRIYFSGLSGNPAIFRWDFIQYTDDILCPIEIPSLSFDFNALFVFIYF